MNRQAGAREPASALHNSDKIVGHVHALASKGQTHFARFKNDFLGANRVCVFVNIKIVQVNRLFQVFLDEKPLVRKSEVDSRLSDLLRLKRFYFQLALLDQALYVAVGQNSAVVKRSPSVLL